MRFVYGLCAAVVLSVSISACGSDKPAAQPSSTPPTVMPSLTRPTTEQEKAYLAALRRIEPGLVANRERAIRRGVALCERMQHPAGGSMTLAEYTVEELSGGDATISKAQAGQVLKAVKVWCQP